MSDAWIFIWAAIGVVIAVLFPLLSGFIRREFPTTAAVGIPPWLRKYGALLVFSLVTSLIVVAIFRSQTPDEDVAWYTAFLLGFAWEATIEKFTRKDPARI